MRQEVVLPVLILVYLRGRGRREQSVGRVPPVGGEGRRAVPPYGEPGGIVKRRPGCGSAPGRARQPRGGAAAQATLSGSREDVV